MNGGVGPMKFISIAVTGFCYCSSYLYSSKKLFVISKSRKQSQPSSSSPYPKGSDPTPPRITSNLKQNLQFLKLWKEFQRRKNSTPRPATSYRRKKVEKEDLPEDTELYNDPTLTLYYTNQGVDDAVPVLLVDGYNVCGYWMKLKKHFMNGKLDIARQKLIDELITFSSLREVKVVVVFDAMLSGLPTHKDNFAGKRHMEQYDLLIVRGAFVWSCKALVSEIKASKKEVEKMLQEQRSTSFQGKLLKHNLDSEVVDALKDLRKKLSENGNESK